MEDPKVVRRTVVVCLFCLFGLCSALATYFVCKYAFSTKSSTESRPDQTENNEPTLESFYVQYATESAISEANLFVEMKNINKSTMNVILVETRCATRKLMKEYLDNKGFVLNPRQCCAIESTALTNPDREVYIFHSCPLSDDFLSHSPEYVKRLFRYPNVRVVRLNSTEAFLGSPVQELYERGELENSSYPIEHLSDVLRLTLLWRFGGTYCDLDVVTIRSLDELKTNWAAEQRNESLANGVLNFEPWGPAHILLRRILEHLNQHYDSRGWNSNGPLLVTAFILQACKVTTVLEMLKHCYGNFTVFPRRVLYPLYYNRAGEFFKESEGPRLVQTVKRHSYSVHLWNKISHDMVARVGSQQAYSLLAQEFCPRVYRHCGEFL